MTQTEKRLYKSLRSYVAAVARDQASDHRSVYIEDFLVDLATIFGDGCIPIRIDLDAAVQEGVVEAARDCGEAPHDFVPCSEVTFPWSKK